MPNLTLFSRLIVRNLKSTYLICKKGTLVQHGEFYSLCLEHNGKLITFKCLAKLFPVKNPSTLLSLKAEEVQIFEDSLVENSNFDDPLIKARVVSNCRLGLKNTRAFVEQLDFSLRFFVKNWYLRIYSISDLALIVYKECFFSSCAVLKTSINFDKLVRPAYFDGRYEILDNAKEGKTFFYYDLIGVYTQVLKEDFPINGYRFVEKPKDLRKKGFYAVTIRSSNMKTPVLPHRRADNSVVFSNEGFDGFFWNEELELFLTQGGIIEEVHWAFIAEKFGRIFKEFAEACEKGQSRSKFNYFLWKLIPDSFAGRLGQQLKSEEVTLTRLNKYDSTNYDLIYDKLVNSRVLARINVKRSTSASSLLEGNVAYAAIITARTRVLQWKAAQDVVLDGKRLLYYDTDNACTVYTPSVCNKQDSLVRLRDVL